MEITDLRKINQGASGAQAADIIYSNDRKLFEAIDSCQTNLDENALIVAKANSDTGGVVSITIKQDMGSDENAVMSQSAITRELNSIKDSVKDACFINETGKEIVSDAQVLINAKYAEKTAKDIRGRSISAVIDAFNELKANSEKVTKELNERITKLEKELGIEATPSEKTNTGQEA